MDSSSTQGTKMPEVAPPSLGLPCLLSHHTKEEPPSVQPPTPDGWNRVAAELLTASSSDGEPDEVDDFPLGFSATTPCHRAVLPQPQKQPQRQQQQCAPRFLHDESQGKVRGAIIVPSRHTSSDSTQEIADILCEEAMAWEARMQDANARLEEMREQSERRIRELESQVSRLSLENTKLKKQLHLGEVPRQNSRLAVGNQSAGVPLVSSTLGLLPTHLRPSSRSARQTVEAIAETSALTGMVQQIPRSTLSGNQIHDTTALAAATTISPTRALTKTPPRRQQMGCFSPEFPLCPPLLDGRWHPAAGGVAPSMVR